MLEKKRKSLRIQYSLCSLAVQWVPPTENILKFIFSRILLSSPTLKKSPGVISFRLMSLWIFSFPPLSHLQCVRTGWFNRIDTHS